MLQQNPMDLHSTQQMRAIEIAINDVKPNRCDRERIATKLCQMYLTELHVRGLPVVRILLNSNHLSVDRHR